MLLMARCIDKFLAFGKIADKRAMVLVQVTGSIRHLA